MAKNVSNNQTLEEFRQSYNDLVDEVGGLGSLRTSQKNSLEDSINSSIEQYFFCRDCEFDGSDGSSSNRTFSGTDNFGETLQYSVNRLLVFKNGTHYLEVVQTILQPMVQVLLLHHQLQTQTL